MTLLFVFAISACTPDKPDDLPPYPDLASLDAEAGMAYPDTVAFDTSTGTFDMRAVTVEQVLDRARLAMGEIASFESRGCFLWRSSTSGFEKSWVDFSSGAKHPDPYDDDVHLSEWRTVANQAFHLNSDQYWEEAVEPQSEPRTVSQAAENLLRMLDSDGIQLRSTIERTGYGVEVYRLEFTEQQGRPVREGYEIKTVKTTLLVSQESFRIVATLWDQRDEIYFVSTANEIGPETHSRWTEGFMTTRYLNYTSQ